MAKSKKRKLGKRILIIFIILVAILAGTYFALPAEKRKQVIEALGIQNSDYVIDNEFESFVAIRNVSARQAVVGNNWIIKGKIFNTHETKDLNQVTLMFNFSDGVETRTYHHLIRPGNTVGKKFKERFKNHDSAEFESIDVIEAN